MGGVTETWSDVATVWANIRPITGKEYFASGAVQADVTHYVTIRYYDGLTPKHRLVYDGRVFEIRHVLNIQERNTMQLLLAREIL
jgi:SPP1 family predicted phage head-tail adaptor